MGGQASVRSGAGLGPGAFPGARRLCGPGQIRGWSCVPDSHVEALSLTMSLEAAWQAGRHVQPEAVRPRPVCDSALRACGGRAASCHKLRVYRALLPWDGSPLGWSLRVEAEECSLGHRCLLPPWAGREKRVAPAPSLSPGTVCPELTGGRCLLLRGGATGAPPPLASPTQTQGAGPHLWAGRHAVAQGWGQSGGPGLGCEHGATMPAKSPAAAGAWGGAAAAPSALTHEQQRGAERPHPVPLQAP